MKKDNLPFKGGLEETDINKGRGLDLLKLTGESKFVVREERIFNKFY